MGAYFSEKKNIYIYIYKIIFLCDHNFLYIMPNFTCTFASDLNP